ncbi:MAG: MoaD/ThiS family protein [Deltaproteobacteria bacterium]|nr:MoaD/ThiS family protein [Deltaproteobacteria bacterium]
MSIEVEIAHVFRSYFNGQKSVKAEGKTVGECLNDLSSKYPMTKNMIVDSNGNLTNRFEIYLNGQSTYGTGLFTPVKEGDKIDLVYIIHGG